MSTETYLIGYDGSDAAQSASTFAARLAGATGADLIAVCAYPALPRSFGSGAADGADAALIEAADAEAAIVMAGISDASVMERRVLPGSPPKVLTEVADEEHATLIAVGATHRGAIGRIVPGSTGERLLHGAPCAVAVVPSNVVDGAIARIGVAFDGSPESEAAVLHAHELATTLGATVELLAVETPYMVASPDSMSFDQRTTVRQALEREVETRAGEHDAQWTILTGPAGAALADASSNFDLIVAGSRGYGPARAVLTGSVSRHLVDHAACPVIVVPRPDALVGTAAGTAAHVEA